MTVRARWRPAEHWTYLSLGMLDTNAPLDENVRRAPHVLTYEQTCARAAFAPFPPDVLAARAALRAEQRAMDHSPAPATCLATDAAAAS